MSVQKKGLGAKGRGLEALISKQVDTINEKGVTEIDINKISPNREQPRRIFDETALGGAGIVHKAGGSYPACNFG